jgi:endoglucanase
MLKSILVGTSLLVASLMLGSCGEKAEKIQDSAAFITIQGQDLIKPDGTKLFIMGTNLGNWLNPEGYMFKFSKTNSPRFINEMFSQLVGPDHRSGRLCPCRQCSGMVP